VRLLPVIVKQAYCSSANRGGGKRAGCGRHLFGTFLGPGRPKSLAFISNNHGHPAVAATSSPALFKGPGVVAARPGNFGTGVIREASRRPLHRADDHRLPAPEGSGLDNDSETRAREPHALLPLAPGFFAILVGLFFIVLILRSVRYAYERLGVSSNTAIFLLFAH
jgi:hypothetical protein